MTFIDCEVHLNSGSVTVDERNDLIRFGDLFTDVFNVKSIYRQLTYLELVLEMSMDSLGPRGGSPGFPGDKKETVPVSGQSFLVSVGNVYVFV